MREVSVGPFWLLLNTKKKVLRNYFASFPERNSHCHILFCTVQNNDLNKSVCTRFRCFNGGGMLDSRFLGCDTV